jgi:MoaA/NifB/PqqE/SkfB family radical SAM enzyme
MEEYRTGCVQLRSLPRALFVELTQGCNLRCPMCRDEIIPTAGNSMSDDLFDSIAETLFPTAEMVDLRGWGESLILPNVISRIERVASYGAKLRIVTNLSFRRPEVLDALVRVRAQVAVSLDAAEQSTLSQLRRGANLNLILSNIDYLIRAFGHSRNVSVLVAVQRPALRTLPDLIDKVAAYGVKEVKLFSVDVDEPSVLGLKHHEAEVDATLNAMQLRAERAGVLLIASTQLGSLPENHPDVPTCIHPWAYAYFAYNGDVSFCDLLVGSGNREYVVGNLRKSEFADIWNGPAWRRIRGEHAGDRRAEAPQFSHCAWCYKKKYVDFEHIFDASFAGELVQLTRGRTEDKNSPAAYY